MRYLLVFVLGFITHKAVNYAYDVSFEKGFSSQVCQDQYIADITKDSKVDEPLTKRFECTYKQMGIVANLKWILIRPSGLAGEDWTF